MVVTGVPLFLSEAIKCYYSQAFWVKITTLVPAVLFALTSGGASPRPASGRAEPRRSGADRRGIARACGSRWPPPGRWIGFS